MKQLHPKTYWGGLYGNDGEQTITLLGAGGNGVFQTAGVPIPIATTVRNLSLLCPKPAHPAISLDVQVNTGSGWSSTGISATSGAGVITPVKNLNSFAFSAGDLIQGFVSGAQQSFGNALPYTACIETEAGENIYSINGCSNNFSINEAKYGGMLGNGGYAPFGAYAVGSATRSFCAIEGDITRLCSYRHSNPVDTGVWTSFLILNHVPQDGSGGSVDTRVVMNNGDIFKISTFTLPVAFQDIVEVITIRTVSASGFAAFHISNSITLTPTTPGEFMFCGGNNAPILTPIDYRWNDPNASTTPEEYASCVIGTGGVTVHGLYINRTAAVSSPNTITHTLRRNLADTILSIVFPASTLNGNLFGDVDYPEDSLMDILTDTTSTSGGQLHWSAPVSLEEPPIGTATIIIQKIVDPSSSSQEFDFVTDVTGSETFTLGSGGIETASGIAPGTYSVQETPVSGWTTTYDVSNGDDPTAITVASGDTVTVTVTNTRDTVLGTGGIYKIVPGANKRNDTLWNDDFSGTTIVKIP